MTLVNLVFPGQGSQFIGMGKDLYENNADSKLLFDQANEVLGYSISDICFEGPEDALNKTQHTQVAIFIVSACIYQLFAKANLNIAAVAGHSLGEITSYYATGVLDFESALKIVIKRGELMGEAAQQSSGSMAAIIGLDLATIESTINAIEGVKIANYNSPVQYVISGISDAVSTACQSLSDAGAKRVVPLPVSGAFHSELMAPSVPKFQDYLTNFTFNSASHPIILNRSVEPVTDASSLQENLPIQIQSPVRWIESIHYLSNQTSSFIEVGPGKVLSGLIKKINREFSVTPTSDYQSISELVSKVEA
tara:strand:- start:403 stop:1326 length:924 start_codon:yes stop_codon:yes gene_type:complete